MFSIRESDGMYQVSFGYNSGVVAALKARIPATHRSWNGLKKVWLVSGEYSGVLSDLSLLFYGIEAYLPELVSPAQEVKEVREFEVRYIGRVKHRVDGTDSAYGWANNEWCIIFPGNEIKSFFGIDPGKPDSASTLYAVLGVSSQGDQSKIKKAYRAAAMQWHPDHCSEPDAEKQFGMIHDAYEVLGDINKRARYDAGITLESTLGISTPRSIAREWYSPSRCGLVSVSCRRILDKYIVDKILSWESIKNSDGRTLVTSWPMGENHFIERWI